MKTRSWVIGVAAMGYVIFAGSLAWAGGRNWDRRESPHGRIEHAMRTGGVHSGEYARPDYRDRHHVEKKYIRPGIPLYHGQCNHRHGPGKSYKYCVPVRYSPPCRREYHPVVFGSFISGLIVEPGWAVGWTVGLGGR